MSDFPTKHSQFSVQVVGAAILDSLIKPTKILVGQRSAPSSVAGMWEFPGGKVEEEETCQQALIRELHEELGVTAKLGTEITGTFEQGWMLKDTHAMRVFCAEIMDGAPEALQDHSELRWVPLDETILDLEWIPADLPIVEELLKVIMPEALS